MGFVNKYFFGGEVVVNVGEAGNGDSDQSNVLNTLIAGAENYKTENPSNSLFVPGNIVKALKLAIVFVATLTNTQDFFCEF